MDSGGFEPPASCMPCRRATVAPQAHGKIQQDFFGCRASSTALMAKTIRFSSDVVHQHNKEKKQTQAGEM